MSRRVLCCTGFLAQSLLLTAGGSLRAEGKVEFKADKGRTFEFTVRESSTSESDSSRGQFSMKNSMEAVYRIEVAEKKDNGDLSLKVTIASLKAKDEGRDRTFEFDSAKADGGEETAPIRQAIGKPLTVQVSGGRVKEVTGLPELERPADGDRGNFRGFRALRLVGRNAVTSHLELILGSVVQGQSLEKGKEFKLADDRPRGDQDGERRGRGRFGRGERTAILYKYEGEEKSDDSPAAKFVLSPRPPEGDGAERGQRKGAGTALVSLKDGFLLKLHFEAESGGEFDRNGETMKFSRKSKLEVARGAPAPVPVKL
jgi:hypothetical protein